ncbi:MAG TPA: hypothetical protein PL110_16840 [Candidatus Eremiobacteraeota bacterium]|nr:MAG: hypothetical protein BWY64_01913 [bacterium ADurb.Bin363]HPZ09768.1 hypothetical protein [Candidatus Eremiobacteraeota bacterium]
MFCKHCCKKTDEKNRFCGFCGKSLTDEEEVIFFFGPFGVSVCNGRYAIFTWKLNNITRFELTGKGIKAITKSLFVSGKDFNFEVPYKDIISIEKYSTPIPLGLREILGIKFKEGENVREVSICSSSGNIRRAYELLQNNSKTI